MSALEAADGGVLKPFEAAVIDEVGGAFDCTAGEIAAVARVGLVGILETGECTVFKHMGVAVGEQSLGLTNVARRVADGDVFGIEAVGHHVEGRAVEVAVGGIAAAAHTRSDDCCGGILADEADELGGLVLASGIDILLINTGLI